MMNEALREYISTDSQPVTALALRQILRQEIPEYLKEAAIESKAARKKKAAR